MSGANVSLDGGSDLPEKLDVVLEIKEWKGLTFLQGKDFTISATLQGSWLESVPCSLSRRSSCLPLVFAWTRRRCEARRLRSACLKLELHTGSNRAAFLCISLREAQDMLSGKDKSPSFSWRPLVGRGQLLMGVRLQPSAVSVSGDVRPTPPPASAPSPPATPAASQAATLPSPHSLFGLGMLAPLRTLLPPQPTFEWDDDSGYFRMRPPGLADRLYRFAVSVKSACNLDLLLLDGEPRMSGPAAFRFCLPGCPSLLAGSLDHVLAEVIPNHRHGLYFRGSVHAFRKHFCSFPINLSLTIGQDGCLGIVTLNLDEMLRDGEGSSLRMRSDGVFWSERRRPVCSSLSGRVPSGADGSRPTVLVEASLRLVTEQEWLERKNVATEDGGRAADDNHPTSEGLGTDGVDLPEATSRKESPHNSSTTGSSTGDQNRKDSMTDEKELHEIGSTVLVDQAVGTELTSCNKEVAASSSLELLSDAVATSNADKCFSYKLHHVTFSVNWIGSFDKWLYGSLFFSFSHPRVQEPGVLYKIEVDASNHPFPLKTLEATVTYLAPEGQVASRISAWPPTLCVSKSRQPFDADLVEARLCFATGMFSAKVALQRATTGEVVGTALTSWTEPSEVGPCTAEHPQQLGPTVTPVTVELLRQAERRRHLTKKRRAEAAEAKRTARLGQLRNAYEQQLRTHSTRARDILVASEKLYQQACQLKEESRRLDEANERCLLQRKCDRLRRLAEVERRYEQAYQQHIENVEWEERLQEEVQLLEWRNSVLLAELFGKDCAVLNAPVTERIAVLQREIDILNEQKWESFSGEKFLEPSYSDVSEKEAESDETIESESER